MENGTSEVKKACAHPSHAGFAYSRGGLAFGAEWTSAHRAEAHA